MNWKLNDTFSKELPADTNRDNTRRQVEAACFSFVSPRKPSQPTLIHVSDFSENLGFTKEETASEDFRDVFSGAKNIPGSDPYAMCYGGHQFGHWAGQLGDGMKGAGETPYSRTADGLAVLRSSIREHLCSEAMYHLGVPTTRSLSLCLTGDEVMRDIMYDGHPALEKGAVICRVAPSFLRFGNYQIFASRGDTKNLKILTDYTIRHFYPDIKLGEKESYLKFFEAVCDKTLRMVIDWQRVGFVHGVMNTDNMSILGLTIDYGPYGWLENYDPNWTPNTTDRQHRRYRYGNQAAIAHWNLYQLANALYLLTEEAAPLEQALQNFQSKFVVAKIEMMSAKLGLVTKNKADVALISDLEKVLVLSETDMCIFYRLLSEIKKVSSAEAVFSYLEPAFYKPEELEGEIRKQWLIWLESYLVRLQLETVEDIYREKIMKQVNPKYVLRNYMAQLAIDAADEGDYGLINELYELLKQPYAEQPASEKWFAKRPEWARHKVGCSMLSCSS